MTLDNLCELNEKDCIDIINSLSMNETKKLLTDKKEYEKMSKASNPYGDGHASEKIVDAIIDKFKN